MNIRDIISKALIAYDKTKPVIKYLKQNTNLIPISSEYESQRTKFQFMYKDTSELLLETEVELLGVFYDKLNIWSWAWSLPGLKISENYLSKESLIYALKLDLDATYIKSILTTSRGIIKDPTQIDINVGISSYIIKKPYVFPLVDSVKEYNLIYYFVLLDDAALDKLAETISK